MEPIRLAHVTTIDATHRFLLFNQLTAMKAAGYDVATVSPSGPWTAQLNEAGLTHYPIPPLARAWDPAGDLRALSALVRLFRRERFSIVHTHAPKTGILGRIAAQLAGAPVVVNTVHGLFGIEPERPLRRWFYLTLERLAGAYSAFEFCQSREDYDLLLRLKMISPDRCIHLGNGIDLQRFDPEAVPPAERTRLRAELGIPSSALVVGTVGRLVREKGYGEFFEAASRLKPPANRALCVLAVGPAEPARRDALSEEELERAKALGIRLLGMRTDMTRLYSLMDIFVLASYREGLPRAAIEAAAMGKPMVLTDIRGCREVVKDGRNGFLVPPRNANALTSAVQRLIDDEVLRKQFGAASRKKALGEFDERRVIERILIVYESLLAQRARGSLKALGEESAARR